MFRNAFKLYLAKSVPQRHMLDILVEPPPIVRLELRILDALLAPILMQSTHLILRVLEIDQLIANTFHDEYTSGVLVDDGLLVLKFSHIRTVR